MKKQLIYLLLSFGILALFSCENTDYQIYNKKDKDKLFFVNDTLRFTYGLTMDKEVDLRVKVKLIGFVNSSKDRNFQVEAKSDSVTKRGTHYELSDINLMLKDSLEAYIPLDFKKLNLEKNKEYSFTLQLIENGDYEPTDIKQCVVLFSNKDITAPVWWQSAKLGEFNQEKLILFVDFYHQSKELSPVIYENIKGTWGENLDQGTATNLLTIYSYQGYLKRYILLPMYEYYLNSKDPMYQIPNPNN